METLLLIYKLLSVYQNNVFDTRRTLSINILKMTYGLTSVYDSFRLYFVNIKLSYTASSCCDHEKQDSGYFSVFLDHSMCSRTVFLDIFLQEVPSLHCCFWAPIFYYHFRAVIQLRVLQAWPKSVGLIYGYTSLCGWTNDFIEFAIYRDISLKLWQKSW